jgi:hypothetical protein
MTEIVSKLTLKSIGCGKLAIQEATVANKENSVLLATFVGICEKIKPGTVTDANGDERTFVKLLGTFQATNNLTGEIFSSNVALMPSLVADQIAKAVSESENEVEFAVQFLARFSEKAATNYVFSAKPLFETKPTDKMAALMEKAKTASLGLTHSPEPSASALDNAAAELTKEKAVATKKK